MSRPSTFVQQVLVATLLAWALAGAGCRGCGEPPLDAGAEPTADLTPADPALDAVGSAQGRFVGSAACTPCHAEIAAAWEASRHRRTLVPVGPGALPRLAGAPLPEGHAVGVDGVVTAPGPDGAPVAARAAYLVGGRHREDLWVRMDDGRLQVYPISFDVDDGRAFAPLRELAGGHDPPGDTIDHWTRFGRNADLTCYGCHATGARIENAGRSIEGATPRSRWAEAGVGCEACHGPGGDHAAAAKAGTAGGRKLRMTPGLAAEAAVAACAGCHGLRETLSSPFAEAPAHDYGEAVWARAEALARFPQDFEFRDASFADLRPATYQQEAIALGQSGCVRRGGLTCSACHDPHSGALTAAASGPDGGDAACLPCHAKVGAAGRAHSGHEPGRPGGRCFDCHLAAIVRGPGTRPARDHTLAAPSADRNEIPAACAACHTEAQTAAVRKSWQARRLDSRSTARRGTLSRAFAPSAGTGGAAARALGAVAADAGEAWFVRSAALHRVLPLLDAGRGRDAAPGARAALASGHPALRRVAVRVLARAGDPRDLEVLARLAEDPEPFLALEAALALAALGDPGAGPRLTRILGRPDLLGEYRAHLALGREALAARDWPRAENSTLKALQLNPFVVGGWNDLGIARFSSGSTPTARAAWERALALNPRYEATRRNLEATGPPE